MANTAQAKKRARQAEATRMRNASLKSELEKLQRDARGQVPAADDALANQARNRRITRLNSAVQTVYHKMTARN